MKEPIKISLVEDHPEYRETIELAIETEPEFELLCSFGTAERALDHFQANPGSDRPSVMLLDLSLPGMTGLEALVKIRELLPETRVIILTQSDNEQDVVQAMSNSASGYLLKSSTVSQICEGIRTVSEGGAPLDPWIAGYILRTLNDEVPADDKSNILSAREMEVLTLVASGMVKKEIADQLGISTSTVVTHVNHIYTKLDAKNAPAAVAKAFGIGILK